MWNQHDQGEFTPQSEDDFELIDYLQEHDVYQVGHINGDRMRLWAIGLQTILETQSAQDILADRTRNKFFLRPAPISNKNYVLTWQEGTDEIVQGTFHLRDEETVGDLIESWLDFCHNNNFNPNCLIKVDYKK